MIAVSPIATAGISLPGQTDDSSVAADSDANSAFGELLAVLAGALQPQAVSGDNFSDADSGNSLPAPEHEQNAEQSDKNAGELSLLAAALPVPFQPVEILHASRPSIESSADLHAASPNLPSQTFVAPSPVDSPGPTSGADGDPVGALSVNTDDVVVSSEELSQDSNEAVMPQLPVKGSADTKMPSVAKLSSQTKDVTVDEKLTSPLNQSADEIITPKPTVHARQEAPVDAGQELSDNLSDVASTEAPAKPLTAAASAQFSSSAGDKESFQESGKFAPRDPKVELVESAPSRLDSIQGGTPLAPLLAPENPASEILPAAWRPVVQRVAEEIKTRIQFGAHEAVIQLEPPELGKIKIDLRLDGEQIHAHIVAEEPSTQALIDNHWADLRQALDTRQGDFVNVQFDPRTATSGGGQGSQGFNDAPAQGRERGGGSDSEPFADDRIAPRADADGLDQGRISVWV